MNQQPWHAEGFVEYGRPFVAFGVKNGISQALAAVERYAHEIKTPPLPVPVGGDRAKTGLRLMEWTAANARTLKGYPADWIRPNEEIPDEGPWTRWEQTLILNKWLQMIGWDSEVWWQEVSELDENVPAAEAMFSAPVLRLRASAGSNKWNYYQAGQAARFGATVPAITASTLYRTNDKGKAESKRVNPGSASDHRLSMLWRLTLNEGGTAAGTLGVTVTGGWTELLSDGQLPEKSGLADFLKSRINFAMPGLELTPSDVSPANTGYTMEFAVRCAPGVVLRDNLLLRLPGGVPQRLGEMIGMEQEYTFRFPFIIEQKVRIKMRPGYRLIQQPAAVSRGEGTKAVFRQSITHWPKKAELEAESLWAVRTRTVDSTLAFQLRDELAAIMRWPVLNLPFIRR